MLRKQKGKQGSTLAEEARAAFQELRVTIAQAMEVQQWDQADRAILDAIRLLRETSIAAPVTQSEMAELHGRWGLVLNAQRRYEEAYKHLTLAQQLFYMEPESAEAWASSAHLVMQGEGEQVDLRLALDVLTALADSAVRLGQPGTGEVLRQMVQVADSLGDRRASWHARQQLAAFTAGLADWRTLLELGHGMGQIAQQLHSLPHLLEAMRQIAEAATGLTELPQAVEAQQLVVDIARFLGDPSLPEEEQELARLRALL